MTHQDVEFSVEGYGDHKTDFKELFDALNSGIQNLIFDEVVIPAASAESEAAGRFCVVVILGHSDRVDTPGRTPEQRRADELTVSTGRAESAKDWLFGQIAELVLAAGGIVPADIASLQNVSLRTAACGSADLKHLIPSDPAQRAENRRVQFMVSTFSSPSP
ncbi:hypothetical protein ACFY12_13520 [Streptomyces sp. NPDC001339]|uniref:hypothetical protein n=1 Tax=Streptomyces sp. NPDC001339 TaxID=3364563 RepID=UPI0036C84BBA